MTDMINVETNRKRFLLHFPNVLIRQTNNLMPYLYRFWYNGPFNNFDEMAYTIKVLLMWLKSRNNDFLSRNYDFLNLVITTFYLVITTFYLVITTFYLVITTFYLVNTTFYFFFISFIWPF